MIERCSWEKESLYDVYRWRHFDLFGVFVLSRGAVCFGQWLKQLVIKQWLVHNSTIHWEHKSLPLFKRNIHETLLLIYACINHEAKWLYKPCIPASFGSLPVPVPWATSGWVFALWPCSRATTITSWRRMRSVVHLSPRWTVGHRVGRRVHLWDMKSINLLLYPICLQ